MAQKTELSVNGVSGRVHAFIAKTALVIVACFTQNITFDSIDKQLTFDAVDKSLTFNLTCL